MLNSENSQIATVTNRGETFPIFNNKKKKLEYFLFYEWKVLKNNVMY